MNFQKPYFLCSLAIKSRSLRLAARRFPTLAYRALGHWQKVSKSLKPHDIVRNNVVPDETVLRIPLINNASFYFAYAPYLSWKDCSSYGIQLSDLLA